MKKRIAPILAWLNGGRVAGADGLAYTHQTTGLGDMSYRVDKTFDWRQQWYASEASQLGTSWPPGHGYMSRILVSRRSFISANQCPRVADGNST